MKVASSGSFCWNEKCPDFGQGEKGNIRKTGKTEKGVQRYQCKTCKRTFTETKGTMFYRLRHSEEEIIECMEMVGDRNSLAAIHRIKGVKEETVCEWLQRDAKHAEEIKAFFSFHSAPAVLMNGKGSYAILGCRTGALASWSFRGAGAARARNPCTTPLEKLGWAGVHRFRACPRVTARVHPGMTITVTNIETRAPRWPGQPSSRCRYCATKSQPTSCR